MMWDAPTPWVAATAPRSGVWRVRLRVEASRGYARAKKDVSAAVERTLDSTSAISVRGHQIQLRECGDFRRRPQPCDGKETLEDPGLPGG